MKVNTKYKVLQGLYWMLYVLLGGFCVFYLTGRGLAPKEIGTMTAVFGLLSAAFQYYFARFVDAHREITFRRVLTVMGVCLFGIFALLLVPTGKGAVIVIFGLGIFLLNAMLPFVNQIAFYYMERNIYADFGSSRGIGSLTFACLSFVLGKLTKEGNIRVIPQIGMGIMVLFVLVVLSFPVFMIPTDQEKMPEGTNVSMRDFIKKYPSFILMMIGCICLMSFHNIGTAYLLPMIENVGGTTENLGNALFMAAILEIPIMLGFTKILKKFEVERILIFSGVAFTLKALCFYSAKGIGLIYLGQTLQMVSFALNCPATVYYSDKVMEEKDKLTGQALMGMTGILGNVFGAFIGGLILSESGVKAMALFGIVIAACGTVVSFMALLRSRKMQKQSK